MIHRFLFAVAVVCIIDGGTAVVRSATVSGADTALQLISGSASLDDARFSGNRYGLLLQDEAVAAFSGVEVTANDFGLVSIAGGKFGTGVRSFANRKGDTLDIPVVSSAVAPVTVSGREEARELRDAALLGETVWQDRIRISGMVRIREGFGS